MNTTVAQLTMQSLLGRRRALALLALPAVLLGLAVLVRALVGTNEELATELLGAFALGTLMPLVGLIAGTGAIGPEIDDGSVIYLLAKPVRRSVIVVSKLAVAVGTAFVLGVVPVLVAGVVLSGEIGAMTLGYTAGAIAAAFGYCALFLLLAIVTRNAVVIGLLYALVWETVVSQVVPGAQAISIQQWSLAIGERVMGDDAGRLGVAAAVEFRTGVVMLLIVTLGATALAVRRLQRLRLAEEA